MSLVRDLAFAHAVVSALLGAVLGTVLLCQRAAAARRARAARFALVPPYPETATGPAAAAARTPAQTTGPRAAAGPAGPSVVCERKAAAST